MIQNLQRPLLSFREAVSLPWEVLDVLLWTSEKCFECPKGCNFVDAILWYPQMAKQMNYSEHCNRLEKYYTSMYINIYCISILSQSSQFSPTLLSILRDCTYRKMY